jgi:hypothetical protein
MKKLLHLYNYGHNPFPKLGKGGLGYHLPQYKLKGRGFDLDELQFVPDTHMSQTEAEERNQIINDDPLVHEKLEDLKQPMIYPLTQIDEYLEHLDSLDPTYEYNPDTDDLDDYITKIQQKPPSYRNEELRRILETNNKLDRIGEVGLINIAKQLGIINTKTTKKSRPELIDLIIKSDKKQELKDILKDSPKSFYHTKLENKIIRQTELNEYNKQENLQENFNKLASYIKKINPKEDEAYVNSRTTKIMNEYRTKSEQTGKDLNLMVFLKINGVNNPFEFEIPEIDIKSLNKNSTDDDVEKILKQYKNYEIEYAFTFDNQNNKIRKQIFNKLSGELFTRLNDLGYESLQDYVKVMIPDSKFTWSNGIDYFRSTYNVGSGIALEKMLLHKEILPIFKNIFDTKDTFTPTSELTSIPNVEITYSTGAKDTLASACMVDFLSPNFAIDIKDYRKQKGNYFDVQRDKIFGSGSYTPIYKDENGKTKLYNIQLDNYNNKDIVPNSNRDFYFFMIFDDGIYTYNLLDDNNFNSKEINGRIYFYNNSEKINGNFVNENLVNIGYLKKGYNGEPTYFEDVHTKACVRIPKSTANCIVKFT